MTMTVGELRALLEGIDDSTEVRLATQPNYPHEWNVGKLRVVSPVDRDLGNCRSYVESAQRALSQGLEGFTQEDLTEARGELARLEAESEKKILYILEGSYIGYSDSKLWHGED